MGGQCKEPREGRFWEGGVDAKGHLYLSSQRTLVRK